MPPPFRIASPRRPSAPLIISLAALAVASSGTAVAASRLVSVSATNATDATDATNATNATRAVNAAALGGQPPSSYLTSASRLGTPGIVKVIGSAAGDTVRLFASGPFTVTMTCTKTAAGDVSMTVDAVSAEAGSDLNGMLVSAAGTGAHLETRGPTASFQTDNGATINLEAPSGAQVIVSGADGVNSLGTDCWANFAGIA